MSAQVSIMRERDCKSKMQEKKKGRTMRKSSFATRLEPTERNLLSPELRDKKERRC